MPSLSSIARQVRPIIDRLKGTTRPPEPKPEVISFFRYLRPLDWKNENLMFAGADEGDLPYHVGPHGGITLYYHFQPSARKAEFSFSICHTGEAFVRKEGRDAAQADFVKGNLGVLTRINPKLGLTENLFVALVDRLGMSCSFVDHPASEEERAELVIPHTCKFPANKWATLYHTMKFCYAQRISAIEEYDVFELGE